MPDGRRGNLMRLLRSARNDTPYVNLLKSLTIMIAASLQNSLLPTPLLI